MKKKHKQRFEHCVVTPVYDQGNTAIDYIQEREKIGWELVAVAEVSGTLFFKRPV
jgi:hypothetical protein